MQDNESTEPVASQDEAESAEKPPTDPKARALWLLKRRNTGPSAGRETPWSQSSRAGRASSKRPK